MASTSCIPEQYDQTIGIIYNIGNIVKGLYTSRMKRGVKWCLDNAVFTGKFTLDRWLLAMEKGLPYKDTCEFVVVPDVVGDAQKTIDQFRDYRKLVTDYPAAFVSQDGIRQNANRIPWDEFDCLFVGGSDAHKLGAEGGWIIREAKRRGKWVHVGRVNSTSRMLQFWIADSWDGTHLGFMPSDAGKFHAAVLQVRSMKKTKGLFDE